MQLLNDPETAVRIGESGRQGAKKYSWDEVAATYLLAFKLAIERFNLNSKEAEAGPNRQIKAKVPVRD